MTRQRPLSTHLQVYRPQLTSVLSITHRASGVVLTTGTIILALWLVLWLALWLAPAGWLAPVLAGQYVVRFASRAETFSKSLDRLTAAISFAGCMICFFYNASVNYVEKKEKLKEVGFRLHPRHQTRHMR